MEEIVTKTNNGILIIGTVEEIKRHSMTHTKTFEGKDGKPDIVQNKYIYRDINKCLYSKEYDVVEKGKNKKQKHVFEVPANAVNRSESRRREHLSGYEGRLYGMQKTNATDRTRKRNK
jgi:hypothetical protein